jgi:hypothetical protein
MRPGFVHAPLVARKRAQVAEQIALTVPIPRTRGQRQTRLELRTGLGQPAQNIVNVAETVAGVALQRSVLQFAGDDLRRLEVATARFQLTRATAEAAEADERATLAAPISDGAGLHQRRFELRAGRIILAKGHHHPAANPVHPGDLRSVEPGGGAHQ